MKALAAAVGYKGGNLLQGNSFLKLPLWCQDFAYRIRDGLENSNNRSVCIMEVFRRGAVMALGGVAAIVVLAAIIFGGVFAYNYLTADHERLALIDNVNAMCRNGRGVFREPPSSMGVFQQMDYIEAQRDGINECGEAKVRLMGYDMGMDLD